MRADIWLWAARFFKTRRLCREAIDGGKVEVNGVACKPARSMKLGDCVRVTRGEERVEVEVLGLSPRRGPASEAQALYRETDASRTAREAQRERQRLLGAAGPARRPDKKARRQLRQAKHGAGAPRRE
ncbi:MAG TPA: S4 domain-containing protein [Rhodanobacteraceae bacterium]|nr:S4 domain-containing protein [Rhodanobacteraceae bacterium]